MTDTAIAFGLPSYRFTYIYGGDLHAPPSSLGTKAAEWGKARDEAQDRISKVLWPEFRRKTPVVPRGMRENALIAADFEIMKILRPPGQRWYDSAITQSTVGAAPYGKSAARILFRCEDSDYAQIGFDIGSGLQTFRTGFVTFADYVNHVVTDAERIQLRQIITSVGGAKETHDAIPWISISLKDKFQRARPFQFAYEASQDDFEYEMSHTCHSPSLPSGHCFQAAAFALLAHDTLANHAVWGAYVDQLPAWAASVGDRRNCAGLHFPSDNWASWITLATALPLMFLTHDALELARVRLATNIKSSLCYQFAARRPEFDDALKTLTSLGVPDLQPRPAIPASA